MLRDDMSVLTVKVGHGSPVVLLDVIDADEKEHVVGIVRHLFENETARAEGWNIVLEAEGFRAVRGGKVVTFAVWDN